MFQLVEEKPGAVEHESLGEKEIDGRKVIGFHISSQPHDLILWGDPKTGLPVRVEMTSGIEGSVKATLSDFVFNVDIDESLFSLEPPAGYTVTVQYVGVDFETGEEFDSSWSRDEPFTFTIGDGDVIPGWERGVIGMKVGGERRLVIPPDLAYGREGSPPAIAPNATLVFVIDLLAVE